MPPWQAERCFTLRRPVEKVQRLWLRCHPLPQRGSLLPRKNKFEGFCGEGHSHIEAATWLTIRFAFVLSSILSLLLAEQAWVSSLKLSSFVQPLGAKFWINEVDASWKSYTRRSDFAEKCFLWGFKFGASVESLLLAQLERPYLAWELLFGKLETQLRFFFVMEQSTVLICFLF